MEDKIKKALEDVEVLKILKKIIEAMFSLLNLKEKSMSIKNQ